MGLFFKKVHYKQKDPYRSAAIDERIKTRLLLFLEKLYNFIVKIFNIIVFIIVVLIVVWVGYCHNKTLDKRSKTEALKRQKRSVITNNINGIKVYYSYPPSTIKVKSIEVIQCIEMDEALLGNSRAIYDVTYRAKKLNSKEIYIPFITKYNKNKDEVCTDVMGFIER